ncbi:MAG: mechanosensitive ion channel, partial [Candidatus Hadarchaeales archaeon]
MKEWVPSLRTSLQKLASVTVWGIGLILAIGVLGLNTNLLLLLVGLLGLGMLLAMREVLENVGAKYFTDIYVPFKVGDIIRVGEYSGKVIEINPVATVLLTKDE